MFFEYFNKKFEELLDSLLEPLWTWLMAASLKTKVKIALAFSIVGGLMLYPDVPQALFARADVLRRTAAYGQQKIPFSSSIVEKTSSTANRLSQTIQGDLVKLNVTSITPWAAIQSAAAVVNSEMLSIDKDSLVSFVRSNSVPGCSCWTELPLNTTGAQCLFISGWFMATLADLGIPATSEEIQYVLDSQNKDGWWPIFHDVTQSQYASTYSTSWVLIGLLQLKTKSLIATPDINRVNFAITKATSWLLSERLKGPRWKPYPRLSSSEISESISGLALHALHMSIPNQVIELDNEWVANLPLLPISASDGEKYYVDLEGNNSHELDHFEQLRLPWLLIATADAFSGVDLFQKTKALLWLENVLNHESIGLADADERSWWRAELLYALRYTLKKSLT